DVLDAAVSSFRSTSHVALLSGEDEPKNTQLKNALNCYRSADVGHADLGERVLNGQMRLLNQPDDLLLFGSGVSHVSSTPLSIILF
ncbi:MAG: hypothetical protein JXQ99_23430, partial [Hyphomicrobiaceae bacterium]